MKRILVRRNPGEETHVFGSRDSYYGIVVFYRIDQPGEDHWNYEVFLDMKQGSTTQGPFRTLHDAKLKFEEDYKGETK